ncbi:hypothetical protein KL911_000934 [Ogataea haglerorum]|uniref:uncharacterized protein n=1 Tax=Ogataea haglerorum TaxID=1937702 RepID=UPI001C89A6A0|nr:uncharacterized protein KL911_000934 [Ogataea haglerorum]KAG7750526.1 hypothetical protein KL912_001086 [Ogataea haglerorum]KAG7757958.1 hypothetical protein KL911_000934 [Ogataea haglerorum]
MSQRKVCPYFQNGNCRYGNRCHNLHIKNGHEDLKSFTSASSLQAKTEDIRKNIDGILPDVRNGAILTAFSLPPPANVNVISGRDMSYEELRLHYYRDPDTAVREYNSRKQDMIKCLEFVRKDAQKAARYLQLAAEKNPADVKPFINFSIDTNAAPSSTASLPFGNRTSSPFNQQGSSFGSTKNPFGAPAAQSNPFGSAATTKSNPFTSTGSPAFGSAGFGSRPNPFGSQTNTNSVSNPFGSSSGASSAFGKTGFGQQMGAFASAKPNPFGGQSNASANTTSPFGAFSGNTISSARLPLLLGAKLVRSSQVLSEQYHSPLRLTLVLLETSKHLLLLQKAGLVHLGPRRAVLLHSRPPGIVPLARLWPTAAAARHLSSSHHHLLDRLKTRRLANQMCHLLDKRQSLALQHSNRLE